MRTLRPYRALRTAERRMARVYAVYETHREVSNRHPHNRELHNALRDLGLALYGSWPAIQRRK